MLFFLAPLDEFVVRFLDGLDGGGVVDAHRVQRRLHLLLRRAQTLIVLSRVRMKICNPFYNDTIFV